MDASAAKKSPESEPEKKVAESPQPILGALKKAVDHAKQIGENSKGKLEGMMEKLNTFMENLAPVVAYVEGLLNGLLGEDWSEGAKEKTEGVTVSTVKPEDGKGKKLDQPTKAEKPAPEKPAGMKRGATNETHDQLKAREKIVAQKGKVGFFGDSTGNNLLMTSKIPRENNYAVDSSTIYQLMEWIELNEHPEKMATLKGDPEKYNAYLKGNKYSTFPASHYKKMISTIKNSEYLVLSFRGNEAAHGKIKEWIEGLKAFADFAHGENRNLKGIVFLPRPGGSARKLLDKDGNDRVSLHENLKDSEISLQQSSIVTDTRFIAINTQSMLDEEGYLKEDYVEREGEDGPAKLHMRKAGFDKMWKLAKDQGFEIV